MNEERIAKYLEGLLKNKNVDSLLVPAQRSGDESTAPPAYRHKQEMAAEGLKQVKEGRLPTVEQAAGMEAIILPKIRPVLDVVDGKFHTDHPLWLKLNDDAAVRGRLLTAIPSIGRIELPGNLHYPYGGTGFVVGKRLIMTNRHVAAIFSSGVGTRISRKPGYRAGIDFKRELDRKTGPTLEVQRVVMVHPYWDMALLEVDGLPEDAKPLGLSLSDVSADDMIEVAAIGYPAFDSRSDTDVQNDLFRKVFGVKRLQPGTLGGRQDTESFGKLVPASQHNCSTLGGNSGSALVDLEKGEVVALHFGGRYGVTNYGVPSIELARDQRVVDAGVTFAGQPSGGSPSWAPWWQAADEAVGALRPDRANADGPRTRPSPPPLTQIANGTSQSGSVEIVVPLRITIQLGDGAASAPGRPDVRVQTESDSGTEGLVMPWHDANYESRPGYDEKFLGAPVVVPMPEPADARVVALAKDGSTILHYQNFSIVMHARRKLALFTASNVTAEKKLKRPEAGRSYTRKDLSGLGPNDQERWFPDPRLGDEFQLPDVFYTKDNGAFDKGHIVRRDDVAWGKSYDALRRANGDTYHVTNCSPQIAEFNRSALGEDNWGDLENHILTSAASERYCQFAGPVFAAADEVFVGSVGGRERVRVKLPARFWKVIVARTESGIASYGFVLEQDLTDVPVKEMVVPENFVRFLEPLIDLQALAGIRFPRAVLDADQYTTQDGAELAFRAGVKRRSIAEGVVPVSPMV